MNNTVSKLKFHLYFKMIVSWVRIVNGVDRYVTGSMPTAKEEDTGHSSAKPTAEARPRQKRKSLFLLLKGNGSTLKHNDHTIKSVMKCQKQSLDCCGMINQSLEYQRSDPLQ